MEIGFTTGSCSAAGAQGATYLLFSQQPKTEITIMTPKKIPYTCQIKTIYFDEQKAVVGVIKNGGDDPDITTGLMIQTQVRVLEEKEIGDIKVEIIGGKGVGIVTKPGLDQPVGEYAINHVPRNMITAEVIQVAKEFDFHGTIQVEISVEGGEEIGKKTFNPKLGIEGGISILGTTGIVEPMSKQALKDTIWLQCKQRKELGFHWLGITPGNYGAEFMKSYYGYDLKDSIKCSNYIGETLEMAKKLGFQGVLLTGHIGKLIKVSGGILDTHSSNGDCRMELLAAAAILAKTPYETVEQMLHQVTTTAAIQLLQQENKLEETMEIVIQKIQSHLAKFIETDFDIQCILYDNEAGLLGTSAGAISLLQKMKKENEKRKDVLP